MSFLYRLIYVGEYLSGSFVCICFPRLFWINIADFLYTICIKKCLIKQHFLNFTSVAWIKLSTLVSLARRNDRATKNFTYVPNDFCKFISHYQFFLPLSFELAEFFTRKVARPTTLPCRALRLHIQL